MMVFTMLLNVLNYISIDMTLDSIARLMLISTVKPMQQLYLLICSFNRNNQPYFTYTHTLSLDNQTLTN